MAIGETGIQWCKVASNLDTHPKIRRSGRNGREVFLFALRRNAEPGNATRGRLSGDAMAPWYLADMLMMSEADAVEGLARCEQAGLLAQDYEGWTIVGWDDGEWGRPSKSTVPGKDRTLAWRERKEANAVTQPVTLGDEPNVTVTAVTLGDARDDSRSEKIREDHLESATPALALKLGPDPEPEPEKPKGKQQRTKPKTETHPGEHPLVVAAFDRRFRDAYGNPPTWDKTTGGMVATLLTKHAATEIVRRINVLFDSPPKWPPGPYDFRSLVAMFDRLVGSPTTTSTSRPMENLTPVPREPLL